MLLHFKYFPNFVVDMAAKSGADNSRSNSMDDTSLRLLFNDIFQSYEQPLFRLAANLCKDDSMARDIIHDVFLKLWEIDRKSTRLNSSHVKISYAVFCLKKKIRNRTPYW